MKKRWGFIWRRWIDCVFLSDEWREYYGWVEKEFFDILANMADRTSWFLVKTLEGLGFL